MTLRIFISSVQKEFAAERAALRDFLRGDALLRRFFETFLFEEVPAADRRADELYLDAVGRCDVYVGLFGNDYGFEDAQGISPTQREFELATRRHKPRLIFVKGADDREKHPKMRAVIRSAGNELIRRRFVSAAELIGAVYAALVQYLEERELIRTGPFDAAPCPKATLADLDPERMAWFLREARRARGLPLPAEATTPELLTHLNLLNEGRPSQAAVLLFADRLEVWNPGGLPLSLTLAMLRVAHGSVPGNPLLAEALYLTKYIERMGTGTRDMIRRCRDVGLPEPEFSVNDGFVTTVRRIGAVKSRPESRPESLELRVLGLLGGGPLSKTELSAGLGHKEISGQLNKIIRLLLAEQNIEYTISGKPNSRLQKYRLTDKGLALLSALRKGTTAT